MRKQFRKAYGRVAGWGIVLAMLGGVIAIGISVGATTANANGTVRDPSSSLPQNRTSSVVGAPAIVPRLSSDLAGPAFSTSDAASYVTSHPMWRNLAPWSAPTVEKVEFLTSQEVSAILSDESTDMPSNALLCFVQLKGTFTFGNPSGTTITYHVGFEVFDAHTGNFLMAGGLK